MTTMICLDARHPESKSQFTDAVDNTWFSLFKDNNYGMQSSTKLSRNIIGLTNAEHLGKYVPQGGR